MNKQRSVTVELLVIFLFIAGVSAIIWTSHPFGSSPPRPLSTANTDSSDSTTHRNVRVGIESADKVRWANGKTIFKSNCASCHNPKVAQTGPALMGVTQRWEDAGIYRGKSGSQWMHVWIHNWNEAVASGYPYAVNIQHYTESSMNLFPKLTDQEIDDILYYAENPDVATASSVVTCILPDEGY